MIVKHKFYIYICMLTHKYFDIFLFPFHEHFCELNSTAKFTCLITAEWQFEDVESDPSREHRWKADGETESSHATRGAAEPCTATEHVRGTSPSLASPLFTASPPLVSHTSSGQRHLHPQRSHILRTPLPPLWPPAPPWNPTAHNSSVCSVGPDLTIPPATNLDTLQQCKTQRFAPFKA